MHRLPKITHTVLMIVLSTIISACGFHLRGNQQTSHLQSVALPSSTNSPLLSEIRQQAAVLGISIDEQANWSIHLKTINYDKQRISSSQSAVADNFEWTLKADFELSFKQGDKQQFYGPLSAQRRSYFEDNQDQISSKENEENLLLEELRQAVALQILRQTSRIANNPPDCDCNHEDKAATAQ